MTQPSASFSARQPEPLLEIEPVKRTALEKSKAKKIVSKMNQSVAPARFGKEAAAVPDRREQRRRDQVLGLVPFAVKLDGDLVNQIQALARERQTGLNELVGELLRKGLTAG